MSYTIEFTGQVTVAPPLNAAETRYLKRFADSRRWDRPEGPYATNDDDFWAPGAEDRRNRPPQGQPSLWCDWTPTDDGAAIYWNGTEKFQCADEWMEYLIRTFLAPDARLKHELAAALGDRSYEEELRAFTFDHVLNGVIEADGEARRGAWELVVTENRVTTRHS